MDPGLPDGLIMYHYSNPYAYRSMLDGRVYGKTGLLPIRRFLSLSKGDKMPEEAHDGTIQGLLEPEPESWLHNSEFPHLWWELMHDVCCESQVMLLSFELRPTDRAYIVDRAHMERLLYREAKGMRRPTRSIKNAAYQDYWNSRVPISEYAGGYAVPQLTVWSTIEPERLRVEWVRPTEEFWIEVLRRDL